MLCIPHFDHFFPKMSIQEQLLNNMDRCAVLSLLKEEKSKGHKVLCIFFSQHADDGIVYDLSFMEEMGYKQVYLPEKGIYMILYKEKIIKNAFCPISPFSYDHFPITIGAQILKNCKKRWEDIFPN